MRLVRDIWMQIPMKFISDCKGKILWGRTLLNPRTCYQVKIVLLRSMNSDSVPMLVRDNSNGLNDRWILR